jgi:hypothetical protein
MRWERGRPEAALEKKAPLADSRRPSKLSDERDAPNDPPSYARPQMFLNRPGASAAYRVVELIDRWPR